MGQKGNLDDMKLYEIHEEVLSFLTGLFMLFTQKAEDFKLFLTTIIKVCGKFMRFMSSFYFLSDFQHQIPKFFQFLL